MSPAGPRLCLSMIVKNEAHVIERCLASVLPLIDAWAIVDTGSTDGTQARIRAIMREVPGALFERPWVDFAHNRTEALDLARTFGAYTLVIDADDELVIPPGYSLPALDKSAYFFKIDYNNIFYNRIQMIRSGSGWRYRGVLHEFLDNGTEGGEYGSLPLTIKINRGGARSLDPDTYRQDARILERALATETDPLLVSRYTFYLAQSYRDSGQHAQALEFYLRRARQGHWREEIYVSLLEAGRAMEALRRDPDEVLDLYEQASRVSDGRVEARHAASRLCRTLGRYRAGYEVARSGLRTAPPSDGLFVEHWIYSYGLLDEFAVNAYWSGFYRDSLDATLTALERGGVPASEQGRLIRNMRFALDASATQSAA